MLTSFRLANFKSFRQASLPLAELTLMIGANASGKSNALEALHLFSWMASGRRLSDVQKAIQDGDLVVRGVTADLGFGGEPNTPIALGCALAYADKTLNLDLSVMSRDGEMRILEETLECPEERGNLPLYWVEGGASAYSNEIRVGYNNFARGGKKPTIACVDLQPVYTQIQTPARFGATHRRAQEVIPTSARHVQDTLQAILFLDPSPRQMREYSFITDKRLKGDGANLSSVLYELVHNRGMEKAILEFVHDLPEQELLGVDFVRTPRNEVMVQLIESFGGQTNKCEAALLSDGTLRVLAVAAALLSVPEGTLVVIEELDNGVHPAHAGALLQRIQKVARSRSLRVLMTTHNPAMLDALPPGAVADVVACYRSPDDGDSRLVRLRDLGNYPGLVTRGPLGRLMTRGVLDGCDP
jgi:predicted ATPase